jgi:hypothetical protein
VVGLLALDHCASSIATYPAPPRPWAGGDFARSKRRRALLLIFKLRKSQRHSPVLAGVNGMHPAGVAGIGFPYGKDTGGKLKATLSLLLPMIFSVSP